MIKQFINPHRTSNNWLVQLDKKNCILIDIGNFDQKLLFNFLKENSLTIVALILTHEHADHTMGLMDFLDNVKVPVFCTEKCATNVGDKRQNFSYYLEDIDTFEYDFEPTFVSDLSSLKLFDKELIFFEAPGHSPGGLIVKIGSYWFTGDTILNKIKTPLNFPHSNKKHFQMSLHKVLALFELGDTIFPGHGEQFLYEYENQLDYCSK